MSNGKITVRIEAVLDERDLQILQLKAKGKTAQQTGAEVFLSPRTVEARLDGLRRLLGAKNAYHLIYMAMKQRLIK